MDKESYLNIIRQLKEIYGTLEMDLATSTYFFESADSNSFQSEYKILTNIGKIIDDIYYLLEKKS